MSDKPDHTPDDKKPKTEPAGSPPVDPDSRSATTDDATPAPEADISAPDEKAASPSPQSAAPVSSGYKTESSVEADEAEESATAAPASAEPPADDSDVMQNTALKDIMQEGRELGQEERDAAAASLEERKKRLQETPPPVNPVSTATDLNRVALEKERDADARSDGDPEAETAAEKPSEKVSVPGPDDGGTVKPDVAEDETLPPPDSGKPSPEKSDLEKPAVDSPVTAPAVIVIRTPPELEAELVSWFQGLPKWVQGGLLLTLTTTVIAIVGSLAGILPEADSVFGLVAVWLGVNLIYFPLAGLILAIEFIQEGVESRRRNRNKKATEIIPPDANMLPDKKEPARPKMLNYYLRHWRRFLIGFVSGAPLLVTILINLDISEISNSGSEFFELMELTTVSYYLAGMAWAVMLFAGLLVVLGALWSIYAFVQLMRRRSRQSNT